MGEGFNRFSSDSVYCVFAVRRDLFAARVTFFTRRCAWLSFALSFGRLAVFFGISREEYLFDLENAKFLS
jgi:hypothetical protein